MLGSSQSKLYVSSEASTIPHLYFFSSEFQSTSDVVSHLDELQLVGEHFPGDIEVLEGEELERELGLADLSLTAMKGNQDYGNGCAKNMMALHVVTKHLQIWNTQQKVKKNDCKAVFLSGENPFLLRAMILFHLKETFGIKYSVNFSHFE